MNAKDLRNQIAKQCGFNDQQGETYQGGIWSDAHCNDFQQGETPNKAKLDWPTIKEQEDYWSYRDEHLAEIESNAQFYDETIRDAGRNEDGSGESYAERNH